MATDVERAPHTVCSAHAEVIPEGIGYVNPDCGLLRTRGGDPLGRRQPERAGLSAPHTRR